MDIPSTNEKIDLVIFQGRKIIYSSLPHPYKINYHTNVIKYDPKHELSREEYKNCYYCSNRSEFQELLTYFFKNTADFISANCSDDILDQSDTIRLGNKYKNL